ncbi:MAG: class I SAM-dependent methyltransferase [Candidatus Moraniibacteriota bacterium]
MPTSQNYQISKIIEAIISHNPNSILDIGVGFGKYGVLCREYLELWDGREKYSDFKRKIDGVEVFESYITPLHRFIYDEIHIGDATKIINDLKNSYDLVLLIDVLEHFEKKAGSDLIKKILSKNKAVLISVPKNIGDQKEVFSNQYETHLAEWVKKDFKKFGKTFFISDFESHIVLLGDAKTISSLRKKYYFRKARYIFGSVPYIKEIYHYLRDRKNKA